MPCCASYCSHSRTNGRGERRTKRPYASMSGVVGIFLTHTLRVVTGDTISEGGVAVALTKVMGLAAVVLVWISQTRFNTANYYLASGNLEALGSEFLKVTLPRWIWATAGSVVMYLVMPRFHSDLVPVRRAVRQRQARCRKAVAGARCQGLPRFDLCQTPRARRPRRCGHRRRVRRGHGARSDEVGRLAPGRSLAPASPPRGRRSLALEGYSGNNPRGILRNAELPVEVVVQRGHLRCCPRAF